jgi:hypothetical protein
VDSPGINEELYLLSDIGSGGIANLDMEVCQTHGVLLDTIDGETVLAVYQGPDSRVRMLMGS